MMGQPNRPQHVTHNLLGDHGHRHGAHCPAQVSLNRSTAWRLTQYALPPLGGVPVIPRSAVIVVVASGGFAEGDNLRCIGNPLGAFSTARSKRVDLVDQQLVCLTVFLSCFVQGDDESAALSFMLSGRHG
jgi:hypothetical protein